MSLARLLPRLSLIVVGANAGVAAQNDMSWCSERFPNVLDNPFVSSMANLLELVDINGDGRLDVLFNGVVPGVRLALAAPEGGHLVAQNILELEEPIRLAHGDVDGDGNVDVVERLAAGGRARVYLGDGKGAFTYLTNYAMSTGAIPAASDIALGDVNGDGAPDLLATDFTTRELGVRLNTGGGIFGALSVTALPGYPGQLELGDLDGDGDLDVVAHGAGQTARIGVVFNDGAGGFSNPTATSITAFPFVLRDVDGDGRLDLAVATASQGAGALRVFLGQGGANFTLASANPIGAETAHLALGDFNGDGKVDAAIAEEFGATWVLEGLGAGLFSAPRALATIPSQNGLRAADVDGDGYDDLAQLSNSTMGVLYGSPITPLALAEELPLGGIASALAHADVNGDSHTDVVVARAAGGGALLELLRGDSRGRLVGGVTTALSASSRALALGDFNGDARLDVLSASTGGGLLEIVRGMPGGAFAPAMTQLTGAPFAAIAIGDIDADGFDDALAIADGQATLHLLHGGATLPLASTSIALSSPALALACGDLNGDGFDDALIATDDQLFTWLRGSAGGLAAPQFFFTGRTTRSLYAGRIDADAYDDVVFGTAESGLVVRYGGPSGPGFENTVGPLVDLGRTRLADLDSDGRMDCTHSITFGDRQMIGVRRGSPVGWLESTFYSFTQTLVAHEFADLDGDGQAEAICADAQAPLLRISRLRKGARFETYCPAGVSINGCAAQLSASGTPSATSGAGLVLSTTALDGQRSALTFLSVAYPLVQPWASGNSSFLCLTPPILRASVQFSAGTSGACDGSIAIDANAVLAPTNWVAGQITFAQTWVRDPLAPKGSQLSNALTFELGL